MHIGIMQWQRSGLRELERILKQSALRSPQSSASLLRSRPSLVMGGASIQTIFLQTRENLHVGGVENPG